MTFLVLADVVWPALFLSIRMAAWWCVVVGILIEGLALWKFAQVRPAGALLAAVVMNIVSALIGALLLPLLGIRLDALAHATYNAWLDWGTYNREHSRIVSGKEGKKALAGVLFLWQSSDSR